MRYKLLVLFLAGFSTFSIVEAAQKPNVIIILIDDQGYYDLSSYGAEEIKTPRIDALAEEGIRFTDYYAAAPICSPSRAGLLTGCYPRRVGNHIWVHRADSTTGIHPDELTLTELFQAIITPFKVPHFAHLIDLLALPNLMAQHFAF